MCFCGLEGKLIEAETKVIRLEAELQGVEAEGARVKELANESNQMDIEALSEAQMEIATKDDEIAELREALESARGMDQVQSSRQV